MNYPRRFIFRGNASGLSAHIRRPSDMLLPVQAPSSIPVTGGLSSSKAGPHRLGDFLSFDSAETTTKGDYVDANKAIAITLGELKPDEVPTLTTVTVAVRGLKIGGRFSIDSAEVHLAAASPQGDGLEPSIRVINGKLEGIRVDGVQLLPLMDNDTFDRCDTLSKLQDDYEDRFSEDRGGSYYSPSKDASPNLYLSGGIGYGTLVKGYKWVGDAPKRVSPTGVNSFYLDNFGSVYLGEVLVSKLYRRVTMLRFQLGSDRGGEISACEGETNGQHWPV